jgi:signal peptidase II
VPRKYLLLLAVSLSVIVLDQWTKYEVVAELTTHFEGADSVSERLGRLYSEAPEPGFDRLHLTPRRHIEVIPSYFRLRYAENPGAAWGMFGGLPKHIRGPLFHLVSLGAVVLIALYFSKLGASPRNERWARWGLPLVLGGALGNYIDRLARGFVIDFLEAHWRDQAQWPSFNVADSAIVVGVGLLLIDAFVRKEAHRPSSAPTPPAR